MRVLEQVERCRGKAILIGDPAQLPAVGPGGLFAAIAAEHGALVLDHNRRQPDPVERAALARLRAGDSAPYLALAAARGRLLVAKTCDDAKAHLVGDWWSQPGDRNGSVMLAYNRADVADLNAAARDLCDRAGLLGDDRMCIDDFELARDDRVVCLRNDRRIGVSNGTRGTVVAIDAGERSATIRTEAGALVELPARYLQARHVQHGYALTGHRSQGLTVERAFVLLPDRAALKSGATSRSPEPVARPASTCPAPSRNPTSHQAGRCHGAPRSTGSWTRSVSPQPTSSPAASSNAHSTSGGDGSATWLPAAHLSLERDDTQRDARLVAREQAALGPVGRLRHGGRLREEHDRLADRLASLAAELRRLDRAIVTERRALNERARVPKPRTVERAKVIEREPPGLGR
ncbi:MAG: AAA family ATPase [Thermoleophilia bacterium]